LILCCNLFLKKVQSKEEEENSCHLLLYPRVSTGITALEKAIILFL
jgi:hypothetical protein